MQKRIQSPIKHLKWSYFGKRFSAVNFFFQKTPFKMFERVLNKLLLCAKAKQKPNYLVKISKNLRVCEWRLFFSSYTPSQFNYCALVCMGKFLTVPLISKFIKHERELQDFFKMIVLFISKRYWRRANTSPFTKIVYSIQYKTMCNIHQLRFSKLEEASLQ